MSHYLDYLKDKIIAIEKIKHWSKNPSPSNDEIYYLCEHYPLEVRKLVLDKNPNLYETHLKTQVENSITRLGLDLNIKVKLDDYAILKQWLKVFLIIILCCYVYTSWNYLHILNKNDKIPNNFSFIWIISSYYLIYLILKKIKIEWAPLIYFAFTFLLGLGLYQIVNPFTNNKFFFPERPRYVGVFSNKLNEIDFVGRYDEREVHVTPFIKHELFKIADERLLTTIYDLNEENEIVDIEPFIFWQTGISEGYSPAKIPAYKKPQSFYDRIEIYLTSGPIIIFEAFLIGMYRYLLFSFIVYFSFHFYARHTDENKIPYQIPIIINKY